MERSFDNLSKDVAFMDQNFPKSGILGLKEALVVTMAVLGSLDNLLYIIIQW